MKSLRQLNWHDPTFSNFYSFALKCINDLLPTGNNLSKQISGIYNNWSCPFCKTAPESLQHFLTCPSLEQSWSDITLSIYTHLQLAIGVFPAYIIADLNDMGIRQNIKKIGVSLLKHAMAAFGTNIWIPRCILNAKREK